MMKAEVKYVHGLGPRVYRCAVELPLPCIFLVLFHDSDGVSRGNGRERRR